MANRKPSSAHVKEELCSWQEQSSAHKLSMAEHKVCLKEELCSDQDVIPECSTSADTAVQVKVEPPEDEAPPCDKHPQYLTNSIKEEPCDREGELHPPEDLNNTCESQFLVGGQTRSSYATKEESGEDDPEEAVEFTPVCIKEEPVSGDECHFPAEDIRESSKSSTLGADDESDSLSDHTEMEYTTVCIKGEESSEEDYMEVIHDNYATRDHTYMVMRTDDRMKAPCNTRKLHKTLNCSECGKLFFGKAAYRLHQKLHRGESVYACSTCGKKFSRKSSCEKHQEAAHSPEKSFECAHCERFFSSKLGLTLHQRVHTREASFSCKDCAKSFTSNSALLQHQRLHYTHRRLLCPKCGLAFHNKSDLINHEILHPVQQSFVCSECSEKFLTKAELSTHWKVHTVIRAFSWRKICFTHQETESSTENKAPSAAGAQ